MVVLNVLWMDLDGAPAHRLLTVRERLPEVFNIWALALHCDNDWCPQSPDLTSCDWS